MKKLTVILPTEATLEESEKVGLLSRWKYYFEQYSKYFNLDIYSCDTKNFSNQLNVKHCNLPYSLGFIPYGNHILYNIYLLLNVKKMANVLRVISVSFFILPFIKFFRKKCILSYHYDYKTTTNRDFGGIKALTSGLREELSIKSANIIMCATRELQRKVKNIYRRNSVVVPNFVDTSKFRVMEKENYILYAGRVHWYKGIDYLLEAFVGIENKYPEMKLKIAGLGDNERYKKKANKLSIRNIEFLNAVDYERMPELMGKAKIFVLPSVHREGHPKALIEAMACGCACIASDVEGNRELIQNGKNGLLVKPKDSGSIAEAIIKILDDENLRVTLSENGCKTAKQFSVENTLQKEIELMKSIVKRNASV